MTISDEYKNISNKKMVSRYPKSYKPQPNNDDYRKGWINRYFLKLKTNRESPIIEVSEDEYTKFKNNIIQEKNNLYNMASLRWVISGDINDVQNFNSKTVYNKELFVPDLRYKLSNMLQFWKK